MSKVVEVRPDLFVEMAPLTIKQAKLADLIVGEFAGMRATPTALVSLNNKVYPVCAICKIGSSPDSLIPVSPTAGGAAYEAVEDKFTLNELLAALLPAYSELENITEDSIKNASSEAGTSS